MMLLVSAHPSLGGRGGREGMHRTCSIQCSRYACFCAALHVRTGAAQSFHDQEDTAAQPLQAMRIRLKDTQGRSVSTFQVSLP